MKSFEKVFHFFKAHIEGQPLVARHIKIPILVSLHCHSLHLIGHIQAMSRWSNGWMDGKQ